MIDQLLSKKFCYKNYYFFIIFYMTITRFCLKISFPEHYFKIDFVTKICINCQQFSKDNLPDLNISMRRQS